MLTNVDIWEAYEMTDTRDEHEAALVRDAAATHATAPDFYAAMEQSNVAPLWDRYHALSSNEPRVPDKGCIWRWRDMRPLLYRAAADISMEDAERRVLTLLNPNMPKEGPRRHCHVNASGPRKRT